MRTIVEIPDEQVQALDILGRKHNQSRAELIRRSVALYLSNEKQKSDNAIDKYYGFLKDCPEAFDGLDALAYEQKIRSEWDHREHYSRWGFNDGADNTYDHTQPADKPKGKK